MYGSKYQWAEFSMGTYVKRDRVYKTERFEFDLDLCTAYSYEWWMFVIRVGNTIYVNAARYSMQTDAHQHMAKNIIECSEPERHGLKVVSVYYREGLNHLDTAIRNMRFEITQLTQAIAKPRSRKATNANRRERIKDLKARIVETKKLMRIIDKQITRNAELKAAKNTEQYERKFKREQLKRMRTERLERERIEHISQSAPVEYTGLRLVRSEGAL